MKDNQGLSNCTSCIRVSVYDFFFFREFPNQSLLKLRIDVSLVTPVAILAASFLYFFFLVPFFIITVVTPNNVRIFKNRSFECCINCF